jgi:hypothetical protein
MQHAIADSSTKSEQEETSMRKTTVSLDNTSHGRGCKDEHTRNSKENLTTR